MLCPATRGGAASTFRFAFKSDPPPWATPRNCQHGYPRAHKVAPCYARQLPGALPQRFVSLLKTTRYPGSLHATANTETAVPQVELHNSYLFPISKKYVIMISILLEIFWGKSRPTIDSGACRMLHFPCVLKGFWVGDAGVHEPHTFCKRFPTPAKYAGSLIWRRCSPFGYPYKKSLERFLGIFWWDFFLRGFPSSTHKVAPCYAWQLPGALPQRFVSLLRTIRYPGPLHATANTDTPAPTRSRHAKPGMTFRKF